ncbi:MAG: MFS transporter [Acidobacteria bacterium]|nr:MFS transporter [Acidobacteriota bacterium]
MPRIRIPRFRYVIAILLLLATMINYVDRLMIAVVSPVLRQELHLSERDYGQILAWFMVAYAIMYAASGPIADRLGTRKSFALFVSVWSLAAMGHALARGKRSLIFWRFLLGLGEPGNFPAAAKAVTEWFPPEQRALGVGIFNAGSSLGSVLAPPMVVFLTLHFGWRSAFLLTGSLGLIWLVFWLLLYQPPHKSRFLTGREWDFLKGKVRPPEETLPARAPRGEWLRVLRMRECYTLILARFFSDPVIYFIIFWLPEYLKKERQFDLAMIGKYAWVPFIFGDVGYLFGGWVSGYFMRRGLSLPRARRRVLLMAAVLTPISILAPFVSQAWMAIGLTSVVVFAHALWISNLLTLPTDLFPGPRVGTATGLSGMGGAVGGVLANYVTGFIVQNFSYKPIFIAAGLMHPLACLIVLTLLRRTLKRLEA